MSTRSILRIGSAALCALLLASAVRAESCSDILWHGIYDELSYESAEEFQKDFRLVLNMSREEREKYLREKEGSLTIGLKKILTLGLAGGDTEETLSEMKQSLSVDEKLSWNSKSFQKVQLKLVNPKIVDAWKECMLKHRGGIQVEVLGDKEQNFIVQVNYTPTQRDHAKSIKVTQVTVVGAVPKGPAILKDGCEIQSYSGLSQIYSRKDKAQVDIVINFNGHPTIRETLGKIPPPPLPPPPEMITAANLVFNTKDDNKEGGVVTVELWSAGKVIWSKKYGDLPANQPDENWKDPSQHSFNEAPNIVLPKMPVVAKLRLTDRKKVNIRWAGSVDFVFTTNRAKTSKYGGNFVLDTTGPGRPRSDECDVPAKN